MTQIATSLRFVELSAVVELLAGVSSTGRLRVSSGDWSGEIVLRHGQIVGASLGEERGLAALESMTIGFSDSILNFADTPVADDGEALLTTDEQFAYLKRLEAERERINKLIGSLDRVPRLVDVPVDGSFEAKVTLEAATLKMVPQLIFGHTLAQIGRRRGLARTLRDVAVLVQAGVLQLEAQPEIPHVPAPTNLRTLPTRSAEAPRTATAPSRVAPVHGVRMAAVPPTPVERHVTAPVTAAGPTRVPVTGWRAALVQLFYRPQSAQSPVVQPRARKDSPSARAYYAIPAAAAPADRWA